MDEKKTVLLLAAVGAITLLAGTVFSFSIEASLQQFLPPFMYGQLCVQHQSGGYLLAMPTDSQVCGEINDVSVGFDADSCKYFPLSQRQACRTLIEVYNERKSDCQSAILSGQQSRFQQGSPEASQACSELSA